MSRFARAGVEHPALLNLAASACHSEAHFDEALQLLTRARERRYLEQMAPVLPLLNPWVERFGYASE
jgi:hypothetical protein